MPEEQNHEHELHIVVRTPAGATDKISVDKSELVVGVVDKAVTHFVEKHELVPGDYTLDLVRDGHATSMLDTEAMHHYGIHDDDVLCLVNSEPQVDG